MGAKSANGALRGHPDYPMRGRALDIDLLHVFITVALCGSFTAAAQVLNRTQAAVSLQIKRLEDITRVQLLDRSSHQVQLTAKGQILIEYARKMLALQEDALAKLDSEAISGRVRVGVFHQFAEETLPSILSAFSVQYPDVWVEVQIGLAKIMPMRLGIDFDLVIGLSQQNAGRGALVRRDAVHWYTSTKHQQHLRKPLPLVLLPEGSLFREWAIEALNRARRPWHIAQCSAAGLVEPAVSAGLGIGVFKDGTVTTPDLRVLTTEDGFPPLPAVDVTIETASEYCSPAARKLEEFILDHLSTRDDYSGGASGLVSYVEHNKS
jgi:DNA-binding transcriptional LysR family regulator